MTGDDREFEIISTVALDAALAEATDTDAETIRRQAEAVLIESPADAEVVGDE